MVNKIFFCFTLGKFAYDRSQDEGEWHEVIVVNLPKIVKNK